MVDLSSSLDVYQRGFPTKNTVEMGYILAEPRFVAELFRKDPKFAESFVKEEDAQFAIDRYRQIGVEIHFVKIL